MKRKICVYEGIDLDIDTMVCPECNEYDGLMPLNLETLDYLGYDPIEWEKEGYFLDWQ